MAAGQLTPVIIGVGDVKNRSQRVEDATEPMRLMLQATFNALEDATPVSSVKKQLQSSIDSINVVATWTWPYPNLPGLLAEKLGVQPKHTIYSEHGGNQPIKLVDEAARTISQGETKVAVMAGGEALASREALQNIENDQMLTCKASGSECMRSCRNKASWLDEA